MRNATEQVLRDIWAAIDRRTIKRLLNKSTPSYLGKNLGSEMFEFTNDYTRCFWLGDVEASNIQISELKKPGKKQIPKAHSSPPSSLGIVPPSSLCPPRWSGAGVGVGMLRGDFQISKFPMFNCSISKFLIFQISKISNFKFPNFQNFKFSNFKFQISKSKVPIFIFRNCKIA